MPAHKRPHPPSKKKGSNAKKQQRPEQWYIDNISREMVDWHRQTTNNSVEVVGRTRCRQIRSDRSVYGVTSRIKHHDRRPIINLSMFLAACPEKYFVKDKQLALVRSAFLLDASAEEIAMFAQKKPYKFSASHLCHNPLCIHPAHVVMEPQFVNIARTTCRGPLAGTGKCGCGSWPPCKAPGTLSPATRSYAAKVYDRELGKYVTVAVGGAPESENDE